MKVQQLIDQLSFISPNYDVMVKVGDSERDLITKIGNIHCVNSKINPPSGFIELETCNAIDWLRAFYNEAIPKADYEARLKADMVAMLEDLDLQIDESAAYNLEVAKVQRLIRDRINKLKEDKK